MANDLLDGPEPKRDTRPMDKVPKQASQNDVSSTYPVFDAAGGGLKKAKFNAAGLRVDDSGNPKGDQGGREIRATCKCLWRNTLFQEGGTAILPDGEEIPPLFELIE